MLVAAAVGVGVCASSTIAAGPTPVKQKVLLKVRVDGTSPYTGVELVIKPGHPACRFKPITHPVKGDGDQDILPIDVETLSADRDCSFAIVLKEPGQPDKIFRRSLQITPATEATAGKPQVLQCYLSSRAITAKAAGTLSTKPVAAKPTPDTSRQR